MNVDVKVIWNKELSFTGIGENGSSVSLDSESPLDGEIGGLKPMELIAIGLAGCTGMDTISILKKKQQQVTSFEVQVHAERATDYPKVFTHITIEYLLHGYNLDPAAVERSIELSANKYCPVEAMLKNACTIEHKYSIYEA